MRIHLVSPAFHGYWRAISDALGARGHQVTTHLYDHNPAWRTRARHHLRHELPHKVGVGQHRGLAREQTASALASVAAARPEAVVVVKGDVLGGAFWDHLDRVGLPRVSWLYDEVRRTRYSPERLARIGPIATYSPLDDSAFRAAGYDSRHLPLAFDHRLTPVSGRGNPDEVTFVGARYANREAVLERLDAEGIPVRAYGRDWSAHPFDRLRTWRITAPALPSGRDLDRAHAYGVMAGSLATLNLHGDQDGFTMRTFEAAGVGAVQLIDRSDVDLHYEAGTEVLAWSDGEELTDLCRRVAADPGWASRLRAAARSRTLAEHTFDHRVAVLEDAWDTV